MCSKENATFARSPVNGVVVYYGSYLWCTENCPDGNPQASSDFILILLGFALPAIIFSTVIPRRWHLDIPEQFFRFGGHGIITVAKLGISLPTICAVATLDMIGWITCIMTFAGPMIFGGALEMLLDYRVVSFLKEGLEIPAREKLEAVVALLCGNFDQAPDDPTARIQDSLIPRAITKSSLETAKSHLATIMNAQTSFGMTIGIPAVFFLVGFVYNAAQPSPTGTVSFGIFWMVLVLVTIISGTLLAGSGPSTVSVLMANLHVRRPRRTRLAFLNDMYDSELYPVQMWDRGFSKYQWLRKTALWQDSRCQQSIFRKRVEVGMWSWAAITITTWLLVATPSFLSFSFDYLLPWPWLGCLSLLYTIYITTQTWLILAALVMAYFNIPFINIYGPWYLFSKGSPRSIFSSLCLFFTVALTGIASLIAALLTVIGSIFQFSSRFESCFCSTPVSSWLTPSQQRTVSLHYEYTSQGYQDYVDLLNTSLYGGAAIFTSIVCFLGWWYQRSLRGALRDVIENIEI